MELVIGGYAQGKRKYVRETMVGSSEEYRKRVVIFDCTKACDTEYVKKLYQHIEEAPDTILISDEIGNGIVPMDPHEREYREQSGRVLIELADQADEVVRVVCGIGQKIK